MLLMDLSEPALRAACETRDSWLLYAKQGRMRAPPRNIERLPLRAQQAVAAMLRGPREPMRSGECYMNVFRALRSAPRSGVRWVEGIVASPTAPVPVAHAWLEVLGYTVDLSSLGTETGYPPPGYVYFGADFDPAAILTVTLQRKVLEPLGVVRMPPPRWPAKTCPTCEGERTVAVGGGYVTCRRCNGDGRVPL